MYRARREVAGLPVPVSSVIVYDALDRTLQKATTLTTPAAEVSVDTTDHRYRGPGEELAQTITSIDPVADIVSITAGYGLGPAGTIAQETTVDVAGVGLTR